MPLTRATLGDIHLFKNIAHAGSFRKASENLNLSPSTLSHAMRNLESRLGVRLFNRTNRSVVLTPAGHELLSYAAPSFTHIADGLEALNRYRDRPAGHLRLNIPTDAARLVLSPIIARYTALYPDVRLEITVDDTVVDITKQGYDAGIRYGGTIPEDMIALPLGPELRWVMAASPEYLAASPPLHTPEDLHHHACIGIRMGSGRIYQWELEKNNTIVTLSTHWSVIANETALSIEIAEHHGGISYNLERRITRQLTQGSLVHVLPEWASMGPPFCLYYSSRRQSPEALKALVRLIKENERH